LCGDAKFFHWQGSWWPLLFLARVITCRRMLRLDYVINNILMLSSCNLF
jgi:hypothetical protein